MPPAVFISYSHREPDATFARQLVRDLRPHVKSVWFDDTSIDAGRRWDKAIEQGILEADVVLSLLSPNMLASANCEDEFNFATVQGKPIIPVWAIHCDEQIIWMRLSRLQRIDFRTDYTGGFWRLVEALNNIQKEAQTPAIQTCPICQATSPMGSPICSNGHAYRPSRLGELVHLKAAEMSAYLTTYQPRTMVTNVGVPDLLAVALPLLSMRNFDAAIPILQRALAADPIHGYANYALALAELRMQRPFLLHYDEAVQIQTLAANAMAYDPGLATAAFLQALIKEDFFTKHGYRVGEPGVITCLSLGRRSKINHDEISALIKLLPHFSSPVMSIIQESAQD